MAKLILALALILCACGHRDPKDEPRVLPDQTNDGEKRTHDYSNKPLTVEDTGRPCEADPRMDMSRVICQDGAVIDMQTGKLWEPLPGNQQRKTQ